MKIGILGGGQLSRMLALAGMPLGFDFCFYIEKPTECITEFHDVMIASFQDQSRLKEFAQACDVITFESENIPVETAQFLASLKPLYPQAEALRIAQDRLFEKQLFTDLGIPVATFKAVNHKADVINFAAMHNFPFFIKKRRNGYDGKGQRYITNAQDIENCAADFFEDSVCELRIAFSREVSIIAIAAKNGERQYYDICENTHEQGILRQTLNRPNDPMFAKAKDYIHRVIDKLDYVGCLVFEFFQVGDELLANEMAPRVHNSGHWTIEAAVTSQFENHVRAITQSALGDCASLGLCKMINLIGTMPDKEQVLGQKGHHLHDYKKQAAVGRKLGHITIYPLLP